MPSLSLLLGLVSPLALVPDARAASQSAGGVPAASNLAVSDPNPPGCQQGHQCALRFNGRNQWIELHNFAGSDAPTFTVETRFNWSGGGSPIGADRGSLADGIPFITLGDSVGPSLSSNIGLFFGIQASTGRLMVVFQAAPLAPGAPGEYYSLLSNTLVVQGEWHQAAASYDGNTLRLFLDTRLDAELILDSPILPNLADARDIYLAAALPHDGKGLAFYKGDLADVRIWDTARSQTEIQAMAGIEDLSDPNLIGHWSMNEGTGIQVHDSSGNGATGLLQNGPTWTNSGPLALSSTTSVNLATSVPNPPTLVSPADGATGISTSPSLTVSASSSNGGNLAVTFYGRVAPTTSRPDFTLIALPDTQKYTFNGTGLFGLQTQWIVNQQNAQNIAFVAHLGDVVDSWWSTAEWSVGSAAMAILEPGIPYGVTWGNCDEDNYGVPPGTTYINTYFPVSRFAGRPYYGGALNNDEGNSYQLFSASGMDFIVIDLQFNFSYYPAQEQTILSWAHGLLQTYSNRRAVVLVHNLLDTSNNFTTDGSAAYNALKDSPNLFLMLGARWDTAGQRQDPGTDGHTIYSLRADYESQPNGGNGWLRVMRFSPETNRIYVTTYSPSLNQYMTDPTNQFALDYNMNGSTFQVIGATTVPSGSNASVSWPNLQSGTQYQWYAGVNDGTSTTYGSVWSFTTAGGGSSTATPTSTATSVAANTATSTPTNTPTATPTSTASSAPSATYSSQPAGTTGMDTFMNLAAPTTNYGTNGYVQIGNAPYGPSYVSRGLLQFDLSSIPANAQVTSATLSLWGYGHNGSASTTIQVYRVLRPWVQNAATWNLYTTGLPWQSPGASGASDYDSTNLWGSVVIPSTTAAWGSRFDLALSPTELTKMISGTYPNYGWVLRTAAELNDQRQVHSSDSTSTTYRPLLVINYLH